MGGHQHVGIAGAVPSHLVPDVFVVFFVGVGADLVAQFVVVGHMAEVRAAEPAVEVVAVAADVVQGAVGHRERGLQSAAERRHGRFGHHGVALHDPDGYAEQADGRPLLPEDVTQRTDDTPVQVVILHRMAVFVGHQLLVPGHRITFDRRRSEEFDAFGQVHDQTVRPEILGVHDERDAHRAVTESVADVGLHGADVEKRAGREVGYRVGIDHPHVGRADGRPPEVRRIGTPGVILGLKRLRCQYGAAGEEYAQEFFQNQPPAFLQR